MNIKIFIDTNIFLNAVLDRDNGISREIFYFLESKDIKVILNDISIINIHYFLTKSKTVSKEDIRKHIKQLINTNIIVPASEMILNSAIDSDFDDFEDSVQYFCAKELNVDLIISDDKKGFLLSDIRVFTSKEFYERYII